jgi:quinol monooxygenase YgiN
MAHLLVRHHVADFAEWKKGFDAHAATRQAAGSKGATLYRDEDDPNMVSVLFAWDSLANAHAFAGSPDLRESMEKAGVQGAPEIHFVEEMGRSEV